MIDGHWEEQHVVWAHWSRTLWGPSEKEFHSGVEWTSRARVHSWVCCQGHMLLPCLGFTSMKWNLIFWLPCGFFLSWYLGFSHFRGNRKSLGALILSGLLSPAMDQSVINYKQFCIHLSCPKLLVGSWRTCRQHCQCKEDSSNFEL